MSRKNGFTLVEILVVLGILCVLSAVGMSVIGSARERSRIATCTSNLQQIHLAREMYKQDYDGNVPSSLRRLYPVHLSDRQLLVCPNDPFVHRGGWEWAGWQGIGIPPRDGRPPQSYAYTSVFDPPRPYSLPDIPHEDWERILPTAGYVVCQLHGDLMGSSATMPKGEEFPTIYKGLTLRLRLDGSVHKVQMPKDSGYTSFFHDNER